MDIHSKAAANFNKKAESFFELVQKVEPTNKESKNIESNFEPDIFIPDSHRIKESDLIGELSQTIEDQNGNVTYILNVNQEQYILIEKDNAIALFVESIHKDKNINNIATQKTINKLFISWIRNRIVQLKAESFTEYLLYELVKIVDTYEVWMPINNLFIEKSFNIGKIVFKPITKEFIDQLIPSKEILGDKVKEYENQLRTELQGFTASTLTVKSEPDRAHELLLTMTQDSLSILRVFSIAAMSPKYTCNYYIKGSEKKQNATWITMKNNKLHRITKSVLNQQMTNSEFLDQNTINQHFRCGLAVINNILLKEKKTSFEEKVINFLIIYSKCTTTDILSDKLIYIFSAFESIFLKDSSEPIQQNLGERIAFLIGNTVEERIDIIKNLKIVYVLRSKVVHHGVSIRETESLEKFMLNTWVAITQIIEHTLSKETQLDFIDYLDNKKLS